MTFAARSMGANFGTVINTYTTGTGATETVPSGATAVVIELWGGGGGGSRDNAGGIGTGGGSGAYCKKTQSVSGGTFTYTVGTAGVGKVTTDGNGTSAGTASTITSPALTANGGNPGLVSGASPVASTATGGDVNTSGNVPATNSVLGKGAPNGGADVTGAVGSTPGGGGSGNQGIGNGFNGAAGQIRFTYS
jgi:hypothetical protein